MDPRAYVEKNPLPEHSREMGPRQFQLIHLFVAMACVGVVLAIARSPYVDEVMLAIARSPFVDEIVLVAIVGTAITCYTLLIEGLVR